MSRTYEGNLVSPKGRFALCVGIDSYPAPYRVNQAASIVGNKLVEMSDANGTFHAWPAGGNPPTPAPDASIPGPAAGQTKTIRMPKFSGRIYFSYGQKMVFKLTTGGLVQPAVQNPGRRREHRTRAPQ